MQGWPLLIEIGIIAVAIIALGILLWRLSHASRRGVSGPVRFTPHASERMTLRGVTEDDVLTLLARPDRVVPTTYADRSGEQERDSVRLEKDFRARGRMLKVWVPPDWRSENPVVVKSVAWRYVETFKIPRARAGSIIGRRGQTVQNLERSFDVRIKVERRSGTVHILGDDLESVAAARLQIRHLAG
ncbi:MAG: KH domain-containing protein [Pseudolysinimonas sp.]|uniref:KH domain-containing protein n=1 Tax=Pseudolysinimonas sp. TaxID=2680009 RepID=UPI0032648640